MKDKPEPPNPFFFKTPVRGKYFRGRDSLLKKIFNYINTGESVSIVGERRTGKTSILLRVLDLKEEVFSQPSQHVLVLIDFLGLDYRSEIDIWLALLTALLEEMGRDGLETRAVSDAIEQLQSGALVFQTLLKLCRNLANNEIRVTFLFDEFEATVHGKNPVDISFFKMLRNLAQDQYTKLTYVIATRQELSKVEKSLEQSFTSLSSPLFNIFQQLIIPLFSEDEARQVINGLLQSTGLDLAAKLSFWLQRDLLFQLSGFHPFFLQIACYQLFEHCVLSDGTFSDHVPEDEIVSAFLGECSSHFSYYWDISSVKERWLMGRLAKNFADIDIRSSDVPVLKGLQNRCLVVRDADTKSEWRLFSFAFARWIETSQSKSSKDLAEIDSHLSEIEDTPPNERMTVVNDLIQLRHQLDDSVSVCPVEELPHLEDLRTRYERLARPIAQQLQQSCGKQLESYEGRKPADIQERDQALGQVRQILSYIVGLFPERHSQPEILALQTRLDTLSDRLMRAQRLKRLKTLRDQVGDLWKRADKVEEARDGVATGHAIELYKEALDKVNAELQFHSDWEPDETDELYILRGEAQRRYDDMRNRHEIPTTKQKGEELVPLIIDFAERAKRDPPELVTYFVSAEPAAQAQSMEVAKALEIARQRLLDLIWRDKIEQYVQDTDSKMEAHRPREAMAALRAWESLPGLYDERVGVDLPRNLTLRVEDAERRIKPGLQALEQAEKTVRQAHLESDPLKAYSLWQKAQTTYDHLGDLEQAREEIVKQAVSEADRLLREAREWLEKEAWKLCRSRLARVRRLLALDPALDSRFQGQYGRLQRIYDDVQPLTLRGRKRLRFEEERALLEKLEQGYEESYWKSWPRLQGRLAELQARGDVRETQSEVDALCTPEVAVEALELLYRDCREMSDHPPQGISARDQEQLTKAVTRLEAWIGFARARDELGKASDLAASDDADVASGLVVSPDLEVARKGIRATQNDPRAAQAVRDMRLSERLRQLKGNDTHAKQALEEAQRLLDTPSLDSSRKALRQINRWLRKPTSHRAELLELSYDAQLTQLQGIEAEIRNLISSAQKDWYASLDASVIEDLLEEASSLPRRHLRLGESESLTDLAQGHIAIVQAHKLEQAAERDNASWDGVKSAWETAGEKVKRDRELQEYCMQRAKQAHKRNEFIRARHTANSERAERILRSLCKDAALRDDWEVWFRHSTHCLEYAQTLLRTAQASQLEKVMDYLSRARDSLGRASRTLSDDPVPSDEAVQIQSVWVDLWEKLASEQRAIQLKLQPSGGRLTASACREARGRFEEAVKFLGAGEPLQLLEEFWGTQRDAARATLEAQFSRSGDIFEQMDALSGVSILFPEDEIAKGKLSGLVMEAHRQIKERVNDIVFDSTAERFLARYARKKKGGPPEGQDVVGLQLDETQHLIGNVETLKIVSRVSPGQFPAVNVPPGALDEEEEYLRDWERQLRDMQRAMDQAFRLARDGLRVPEQFEKVKYILWQGGRGGPAYLRVPPTFKDQAHPSYRWCQEHVNQLEQRRMKQEKLRHQIELCLEYEQVVKSDDLPSDVRYPEKRILVDELRQRLQAVHQSYPIEQALKMVREMQHQEPDDACGLQETMSYRDPEDGDRFYESLVSIREVIQRKVDQSHTLRKWLRQFTFGASATYGDCPGIVDWDEKRGRIEQLRDSGLHGLMQVRMECRNVRLGDEDLYQGLLSLTAAYQALSREEMFAQLREREEIAGPGTETDVVLCAVAQGIDSEREGLRQRLGKQIEECLNTEQDIERRIERYELSWDRFVDAYIALMRLKGNWRKSKRWRTLRRAAEEFCGICPNYDEFQKALNEVREKTGMEPPCLRK